MNPWAIVIIVAALILAVAVAVALLAGRFCALTTAPERHPSNWKPADRDGASSALTVLRRKSLTT